VFSSSVLHKTKDNYHCTSNVEIYVSVFHEISTTFLINSYQPCIVALRI